MKKIKETIKGPKPTKWYSICISCGYKTPCATGFVFNCPSCGMPCIVIPCGMTIK
jgi:predicted RNA-binding Zn-ribbon protein involved in translation (DUF1610 family)